MKQADIANMNQEEILAYISDLEAQKAKLAKASGSGPKPIEAFQEDIQCPELNLEAGMVKQEGSTKNFVERHCMAPKEDGGYTTTRPFRPVFKSGPRKGMERLELCVDEGVRVCGSTENSGTYGDKLATSDLRNGKSNFFCPDCVSAMNSKASASKKAYNTQVSAQVTENLAAAKARLTAFDDVDLDSDD